MFPSIESSPDYLARYFRFGTALLHERGLRDILTNILYITRRCYYRQNEANNRISCALLRENHSSPDRFSILPPTLAFDLTDLAILTPVDPSCHVCLRTNCVQCVCVCRFPVCRAIQCRAVSFLVSTWGERGRGRRGGDNVSFARMVTIAGRKPGNSGRRNGRGGRWSDSNKVVFIFMSF